MPDWPDYARPAAAGYQVSDDPGLVRTPFEDGFTRQKRVFSRTKRTLPVVLSLTWDEKTRFEAWVEDELNGGSGTFNFPVIGDGDEVEAQIVGGRVRYALVEPRGLRPWEVTLIAEWWA